MNLQLSLKTKWFEMTKSGIKTKIMLTILKIEKEDIKTSKIGCNIRIAIDEKTEIIFSRDALDELINDYQEIKKTDEIHRDGSVSISSKNNT